jgi:hypothetical protein
MKIKQIHPYLLFVYLAAIFSVMLVAVFHAVPAYALCDENAGTTDQCYLDNYNTLRDKSVTKAQYDEFVQNCRGKGGGLFGLGGADEGSCSNAVLGCVNYVANRATCTDGDKMAELAGCQTGDVTKQNCKAIVNADLANPPVYTDPNQATGNANYCQGTYPQNTAACQAGQNNADCTTYTNQADKTACQNGVASNVCGTASAGSNATIADQRSQCYSDIRNCLNGAKDQQAACMSKATLASQGAINNYANAQQFGNCGEARTVLLKCATTERGAPVIGEVLKIILQIITVLVGIAAVGGLAWAAIKYAKAEDNEGSVKEAKELIRNIVIGIIIYGFVAAIVNWLLPTGVISG